MMGGLMETLREARRLTLLWKSELFASMLPSRYFGSSRRVDADASRLD